MLVEYKYTLMLAFADSVPEEIRHIYAVCTYTCTVLKYTCTRTRVHSGGSSLLYVATRVPVLRYPWIPVHVYSGTGTRVPGWLTTCRQFDVFNTAIIGNTTDGGVSEYTCTYRGSMLLIAYR